MKIVVSVLVLASICSAQGLQSSLIPGGQPNLPGASLAADVVYSNGPINYSGNLISPTGASTTFHAVTATGMPILLPWNVNLTVTLGGAPNAPFALAVSVIRTPFACGSPTTIQCASIPYAPNTLATPFGTYHLTDAANPPVLLFDGLGIGLNPAPASTLDSQGNLGVVGGYQLGGVPIVQNSPGHVAMQALMMDPTSPAGVRLSAALVVAHWEGSN